MLFNQLAKSAQVGFTLVEIAIVMVIIGLLLTNSLRPLSSIVEQRRIKQTDQTLEEIKENLLGYAILHERLPCPAEYIEFDGINDTKVGRENTALCGQEGFLPWVDLAVGRYDGWGNPFRYQADTNYTDSGGIPDSLKTSETDRLRVEDRAGSNLTSNEKNSSVENSRLAAVIYSYGKNNVGEDKNSDNNHIYVQGDYFEDKNDATNTFDDRVIWLSKYILSKRLIEAQLWPPQP